MVICCLQFTKPPLPLVDLAWPASVAISTLSSHTGIYMAYPMVAGGLGRLQSSECCPTIRDRELKQKEVSSGHPVKSYRGHRVLRLVVVNSRTEQVILSIILSVVSTGKLFGAVVFPD